MGLKSFRDALPGNKKAPLSRMVSGASGNFFSVSSEVSAGPGGLSAVVGFDVPDAKARAVSVLGKPESPRQASMLHHPACSLRGAGLAGCVDGGG